MNSIPRSIKIASQLRDVSLGQLKQYSEAYYLYSNAKTNEKEEFYKKNNIDEDEMHWLGSGDFGDAYEIGNNKVLKITKSKEEFDIAKKLINQKFDGFVDYFDAEEINNEYMIIMEMLDTPSSIEDTFSELQSILDEQGIPITYIDQYLDTDELDLDDDMVSFISDIEDVVRSYRKMGIETGDIRSENLGYDKHNKLKAFDIFERT